MTQVNFCSIPFLTPTYEKVIDFENEQNRENYFNSKIVFSADLNIKYDGERSQFTIPRSHGDIYNVDYLWYKDGSKTYYYFITNKIFETKTNCTILIELDIWTTYLFNYVVLDSFVDRCHVPRWIDGFPTQHTIDEGLDMGEIEQYGDPIKIADFNDSLIITATVPIGKVPNVGGGNGGGTGD